jgi:hypothetical protein
MNDERGELITVTEALAILPCSRQMITKWLRERLDAATGLSLGGRVEGKQIAGLIWLVYRHTAEAAAADLSWRSGAPRGAKKPGGTKRKKAS